MSEQQTQYIPIYFGDDTDFNDRVFVTVNIQTQMDLSGMTATLYLGQLKKDYSMVNNSFEITLSANETKTLPFGELMGQIALFDTSNRRRTITSQVPFYVSKTVAGADPVEINLHVEEDSEVAYVTIDSALAEQLSTRISANETAITSLQTQSTTLGNNLLTEAQTRAQADSDLNARINQLNFIQFVNALPASGESKYIYAVPQEETDLDDHPIVVLYLWNSADSEWNAIGAFSTNVDPATLATKTELQTLGQTVANTYVANTQKGAASGVASLDANAKVTASQIPYATAASIGGIKQSFDATTGTWTVITEDL